MNVPGYLQSRECVLADDLTMAFSGNDSEKLDKVKKLPEVNYLDFEVQRLCKGLQLFDSIYTDDTPISNKQPTVSTASAVASASSTSGKGPAVRTAGGCTKSDLFGAAKPAPAAPVLSSSGASSGNNSGRPSPPPPPPPPLPTPAEVADEYGNGNDTDNDDADAGGVEVDLNDLHIDGEEGEEEGTKDAIAAPEQFANANVPEQEERQVKEEEEEDEIDLS